MEDFTQNREERAPDPVIADKTNALKYDGRTGQVFKIWLLNFFMNILTIGIYKFWGKTRLRKYIAGSFLLDNDRFEYTGTGGELFKGFLKALPILFLIYVPFITATVMTGEDAVWPSLLLLPFLVFFGIAQFAALRYRLSRVRWRGIRGYMEGSAIQYGFFSLWRTFLSFISLGLLIPHSDLARHKYKVERMHFGNVNATFDGSAKKLFVIHLITYLAFLPFFIGLGMSGFLKGQEMIKRAEYIQAERAFLCENYMSDNRINNPEQCPPLEDLRTYGDVNNLEFQPPEKLQDLENPQNDEIFGESLDKVMGFYWVLIGLSLFMFVARFWYKAALTREKFNGITIGDVKFNSTVTGWAMFRHIFGNLLILIITLGLGKAITIQRNMKFFARHTSVIGDLDTSQILQAKNQDISVGEGLDDAFGLDTGLF